MKTKIPPLKKRAHLAHKDPADVAILIKGIQLCLHEVHPAMTSLFPEHPVIQSFENLVKKILSQSHKLASEEMHLKLTQAFVSLLHQSKINIDQIYPNRLLMLFNRHLSRTHIYDMNCRIYDKPRTTLSMELLAKILGCSRNQLNYRQQQIDDAYRLKLSVLKAKCEALNYPHINPSMFWRTEHA